MKYVLNEDFNHFNSLVPTVRVFKKPLWHFILEAFSEPRVQLYRERAALKNIICYNVK
jgi:hypothetical protein